MRWLSWSYRAGRGLVLCLPRTASYRCVTGLADLHYAFSTKDRQAVGRNLAEILGHGHPGIPAASREVFRNFAKYLVDFFRLERFDAAFLAQYVTVQGREYLDEALRGGRGVILLSAHLGNYELGAAVMTTLGYPVSAIVLTHQDPDIDAFFTHQRRAERVTAIPVGMALRQGFICLRRNELLAVVGDRDFSQNGLEVTLLGRPTRVPKGPAMFSVRTGAPILPAFCIREPRDRFRMILERPILPRTDADELTEIRRLTQAGTAVLEQYIRQYPTQWYLFQDFDRPGPAVIL